MATPEQIKKAVEYAKQNPTSDFAKRLRAKIEAGDQQILSDMQSAGYNMGKPSNPVGAPTTQSAFAGTPSLSTATPPQAQQTVEPQQGKSVGDFAKNVAKSGFDVVKGLGHLVAHPVESVKNIGGAAIGAAELLIPGEQGQENKARAVGNFFKNRYGSWDKIKNTLYTDPVGVLLDAATVLSAGGGAAVKLGTVGKAVEMADVLEAAEAAKAASLGVEVGDATAALTKAEKASITAAAVKSGKLGKVAQIGSMAAKAGETIDPLRAMTRVAAPVVRKAGEIVGKTGKTALGFTTGMGKTAVEDIYQAGKAGGSTAIEDTMRGTKGAEDIFETAKQGMKDLKDERRATYRSNLEKVQNETMQNKNGQWYVKKVVTKDDVARGWAAKNAVGTESWVPTDLSVKGLKRVTTSTLREFNIGAKGAEELDFSRTALPKSMQNDLNEVVQRIYGWKDMSPTGLDDLREIIANYYKSGAEGKAASKFNAIITKVKSNLSEYVGDRVPQIKEMNSEYAKASADIEKLTKGLSLGDKTLPETGIRKLTSALRENNDMRLQLVKALEEKTGYKLEDMVAGYAASKGLPHGLIGRLLGAGEAVAALHFNLPALLGMAAASPRVVGEFLYALGKGNAKIEAIMERLAPYAAKARLPAAQVGRLSKEIEATQGGSPALPPTQSMQSQ